MVVYDLECRRKHRFEGWFPSFEDYQRQADRGQISCPACGTTKVEKRPHACAVLSHRGEPEPKKEVARREPRPVPPPTASEVKEIVIRLNQYVKENFEDVGERFADEARAIFHGRSEKRSIHGTSTPNEREALDEEGIPYAILPKPELDS